MTLNKSAKALLKDCWGISAAAASVLCAVSAAVVVMSRTAITLSGSDDPVITLVFTLTGWAVCTCLTAPLMLGLKYLLWRDGAPFTDVFFLFARPLVLIRYLRLVFLRSAVVFLPAVLLGLPLAVTGTKQLGLTFAACLVSAVTGAAVSVSLGIRLILTDWLFISDMQCPPSKLLFRSAGIVSAEHKRVLLVLTGLVPYILLVPTGFGILYALPQCTARLTALAKRLIFGQGEF